MVTTPSLLGMDDVSEWDREADVLVIGQGIAGSCAALEAKRAGADVLVIERASGGGGASALSSGIFYLGGGTAVQKACGYDDDAAEMYKYVLASMGPADARAAKLFCDDGAAHFDWLEAQGVPFERSCFKGKAVFLDTTECLMGTGNEKAWPFCEIARPASRGHKAAGTGEHAGSVAMAALLERCEQEGVAALYDASVRALIADGEARIRGVRVRVDGMDLDVAARRAVIIATGGFTMNEEMVKRYFPFLSPTAVPLGTPHSDGSGILLGLSAGAAVRDMDGLIATASIYPPAQLIKGILVNRNGERFVAEDAYHGRTAAFVIEQPEQKAWLVVDSEIFAYPEIESAQHQLVDGWESVAEMEAALGMPEGALQRTVADYNRDVAGGTDHALRKQTEWLKPLDKAPYAAFDISFTSSSYLYITLGGLCTSCDGEVLDDSGRRIAGLYAAGACTAHIPRDGKGYASGMSLGPGSYFGRRAGRHAAAAGAARAGRF